MATPHDDVGYYCRQTTAQQPATLSTVALVEHDDGEDNTYDGCHKDGQIDEQHQEAIQDCPFELKLFCFHTLII